jgi:hypothetical protein
LWEVGVPNDGLEAGQVSLVGVDPAVALVAHETAHFWLPGSSGTDQDAQPWVDEAFATLAQSYMGYGVPDGGKGWELLASKPMSYWSHESNVSYHQGVYFGGARILVRARLLQPSRFDKSVQSWLRSSGGSVVDGAGLVHSLRVHGADGAARLLAGFGMAQKLG